MGAFLKLIDVILFIVFVVIAIGAPLLDTQTCLPSNIFPDILVNLNTWYTHEFGDYLVSEKPHFFVGLIWLELLFAWPLAVASLYGIATGKSWLRTTCLLYGVSTLTAMVAILSELVGSGKASEKLLKLYFPFMGFCCFSHLAWFYATFSQVKCNWHKTRISKKKASLKWLTKMFVGFVLLNSLRTIALL